MVQDGVDWFNDVSPAITVTVTDGAAVPAPTSLAGASRESEDTWGKCFGAVPAGASTPWTAALAAAAAMLLTMMGRRRA